MKQLGGLMHAFVLIAWLLSSASPSFGRDSENPDQKDTTNLVNDFEVIFLKIAGSDPAIYFLLLHLHNLMQH